MRRSLAFLMALAGIATANPTPEWIEVSEFETAPQWFERVELRSMLYTDRYPLDIGGSLIVTNAGTAVVDSGVCFDTWPYIVVLDSTNTTGTFSLGDDSDYIRAYVPVGADTFSWEVKYPWGESWAPPRGASASLFRSYYVDVSPTFGALNDDFGGGIWGHVCNQDSGIDGATVRIKSVYGCGTATLHTYRDTTYGHGYFQLKPTGTGKFVVTVECGGYLPYTYPESIELAPNEGRQLNIYPEPAGLVEEGLAGARIVQLRQCGPTLVLNTGHAGIAVVDVYDNLGRVRTSEKVALHAGSNKLALPGLRSGVYFAGCRLAGRMLKTKLVLY